MAATAHRAYHDPTLSGRSGTQEETTLSPIQILSIALPAVALAIALRRHMNVGLVTIPVGCAISLAALPTGIGPAGYGGRRVS